MASTSFDRDAARRAWRQVARTRGGGTMLGERPMARSWPLWLGGAAIVAWAAWAWLPGDEPGNTATSVASAPARAPATDASTGAATPLGAVIAAASSAVAQNTDAGAAADTAMDSALEDAANISATGASPRAASVAMTPGGHTIAEGPAPTGRTLRPRLEQPLDRDAVPEGTARANAEDYRALPRARGDGEPLGGVGAEALHVDHLAIGSHVRDGLCGGENGRFTVGRQDAVHVCVRLVHRRIAQQILVRWERDGKLVRRQWLPVPSNHAYRTRASLPVKRGFAGRWTARIVSLDGIELGSTKFEIALPPPKSKSKSRKGH